MKTRLKEAFGHMNLVFVGPKTETCRESGKKGTIIYSARRPRGIVVFEDRTTAELKDFNDLTGAAPSGGNFILAVYQLPDSAQPCTIEEIFAVPIEACEKIWELPRSVDDYAVDAFLKGE